VPRLPFAFPCRWVRVSGRNGSIVQHSGPALCNCNPPLLTHYTLHPAPAAMLVHLRLMNSHWGPLVRIPCRWKHCFTWGQLGKQCVPRASGPLLPRVTRLYDVATRKSSQPRRSGFSCRRVQWGQPLAPARGSNTKPQKLCLRSSVCSFQASLTPSMFLRNVDEVLRLIPQLPLRGPQIKRVQMRIGPRSSRMRTDDLTGPRHVPEGSQVG
jgi:hypothetical protein